MTERSKYGYERTHFLIRHKLKKKERCLNRDKLKRKERRRKKNTKKIKCVLYIYIQAETKTTNDDTQQRHTNAASIY